MLFIENEKKKYSNIFLAEGFEAKSMFIPSASYVTSKKIIRKLLNVSDSPIESNIHLFVKRYLIFFIVVFFIGLLFSELKP